jgi:tetratricopeptide (TPR) repeat protein
MTTRIVFRLAVAWLLCFLAPWAHAQMIDDVEISRDGANAVLQVQLVAPVQYLRSVVSRSGDLTQAYYSVLPRRERLNFIAGERRQVGGNGLPVMIITDEPVGRNELTRKLVVRFSEPVKARVRAGRSNRSIEFVMEGLGEAIRPTEAVAALPAGESGRRYVLTLQSSTDPSLRLDAAIPAALQAYQVMTSRRVVDGKTVYDISLGYFAAEDEAQRARSLVLKRFPKATVTALAAPEPVPAAEAASAAAVPADFDAQGAELLAAARLAYQRKDSAVTVETLNRLLELPPNRSSREAQELVGLARIQAGDPQRARAELELFLKLYPIGADADRVRQQLASLPAEQLQPVKARAVAETTTTTSGSVSSYYFGGKSQVRNQEFQDSELGGLVELPGQPAVSATDQKQIVSSVDLNWRRRSAEQDVRFVVRDSYTVDQMPGKANRNRLSALYLDYRSFVNGTSVRLGRQSPNGGGVLGRFDGVQAGYSFMPKWKVNGVAGVPSDSLLDSKRHFYGLSVDAEALTPHLNGSAYVMQQTADGLIDRRAVGTDLRYFNGGVSMSGSLDYDVAIRALNIASAQGTWILEDSTTFNALWDRRAIPLVMLGNGLFFQSLIGARKVSDLVNSQVDANSNPNIYYQNQSLLQSHIKASTPFMTQGLLGVTTPISPAWQVGTDIRLTSISAIPPVPGLSGYENGQASTGNIWSLGGQLIGSNLYSARDTHVFGVSVQTSPTFRGYLASYNNLSAINANWQLEPSLRFYTQKTDTTNGQSKTVRWTPGLRMGYRLWQQLTLEGEASLEISRTESPTGLGTTSIETANRLFYYVGGRYDF